MKKYRIDEITDNLDNLRKPLNSIERSKISKNKLYPYYGANNLMDYVDEYIFDEEILCVAEDGGSWGYREKCSYIVNEKCWVNNHAHVLRAKDNLNIAYLSYYLNYSDLSSSITGTTRGKLTKSALNSIEILLPELEVQNKIVEILDKAQKLIDRRKEQIESLDELVKSKFIDMFGDPYLNNKGFIVETINDVCSSIVRGPFGSALKKEFFVKPGNDTYKVYEQKHAIQKKADIGQYYVSKDKYEELKRFECGAGDILMSCSGTMGELYQLPEECEKGIINQALCKFTLNNKILPIMFLMYMKQTIGNLETKGSGIKNIASVAYVKSMPVIIPPMELQNQFADFVIQTDKLKFEMEKSLKELEDNFNSLMQKAFKGELFN